MSKANPKQLIVEGNDDIALISSIMNKRIPKWKKNNRDYLVHIALADTEKSNGGKNKIDYKNVLRIAKSCTHLGIVTDADDDFSAAEQKIKNIIKDVESTLKENDLKLDFWIMPNNKDPGMIEDFALALIEETSLLGYAGDVSQTAKQQHSAPYKSAHNTKAVVRTWLAWQDEPGIRMGNAVNNNIINAKAADADKFVEWFCGFFELESSAEHE